MFYVNYEQYLNLFIIFKKVITINNCAEKRDTTKRIT